LYVKLHFSIVLTFYYLMQLLRLLLKNRRPSAAKLVVEEAVAEAQVVVSVALLAF